MNIKVKYVGPNELLEGTVSCLTGQQRAHTLGKRADPRSLSEAFGEGPRTPAPRRTCLWKW